MNTRYQKRQSVRTSREPSGPHPVPAIPRLSVIICTYNRRAMILSMLATLRKQTLPYDQFEIIVIDNGSADGTLNAVEAYVRSVFLDGQHDGETWQVHCLSEQRNGLAYARNAGLKVASGDIAVFLDDDIYVEGRFLENLLTAYMETGAAAIGGGVYIRWEAARPYWLTDDLLDLLGYFVPSHTRMQLPSALSFSSSCFSVKIDALQHVRGFTPFLSKRLNAPMNMEIADLCQRLRRAGYTLWYEPTAMIAHRVPRARLERAFLVGRAYWQGRSEIVSWYADLEQYQHVAQRSFLETLRVVYPEIKEMLLLAFLHRPLLSLARQSTNERLLAAIAQAYLWGRIRQQLLLIDHVPALFQQPAVLLVQADERDALFLAQGLLAEGVHCTTSCAKIPFSWLWRHRAHLGQSVGIIHLYRPGAFQLNHWQRQRILLQLWLAQRLGIHIVVSDAGGWWQNVRSLQCLAQRIFERKLLACSNIVLSYTRHPEQLYTDRSILRRVRWLPHPGLRGALVEPVPREQAYKQLGLSRSSGFVFLCLAYLHTEREIIHLIEAFTELHSQLLQKQGAQALKAQLLLIGKPRDKKQAQKILKRAALNSAIHLCIEYDEAAMPLYLGACNALVMPHFAIKAVGMVDVAMLFYSYERIIILPDLPRLREQLPDHAAILYDPGSRNSLVRALLGALAHKYQHQEQEAAELTVDKGWRRYARLLLDLYLPLLAGEGSASPRAYEHG